MRRRSDQPLKSGGRIIGLAATCRWSHEYKLKKAESLWIVTVFLKNSPVTTLYLMMISASHLSRLYNQPEDLHHVLSKIRPENRGKHIVPGKWSIQENLAHLVRYQQETLYRFHCILEKNEPSLKRYVAKEDEKFPEVVSLPFHEQMIRYRESRMQLHSLLETLTDEQLSRMGRHPVMGSLSLSEWIEFFLLHEAHHMMTIFKLAHG